MYLKIQQVWCWRASCEQILELGRDESGRKEAMRRDWILSICFGLLLAGCGQAIPTAFYVSAAPPPPRVEEPIGAGKEGQIWIAGYWNFDRTEYIWVPGHWEAPPRAGKKWRAPYWAQHGNRWRFHEGKWQ